MCSNNVVTLTVSGGALPPGLELTAAGYLRGVPAEPGLFRFLVRAANACGWADREFSLDVSGAPVLLVNPPAVEFRVLAGQRPPDPMLLRVSSDTASLAYTMDPPPVDWLEARVRAGVTPGRGAAFDSDTIALYFDFTRLSPGTHRTALRVSTWRGVAPVEVPIVVTVLPQQAATPPAAQTATPAPVSASPHPEPAGAGSIPMAPRFTSAPPSAPATQTTVPQPDAAQGKTTSVRPPTAPPAAKPAAAPTRTGRLSRSAKFRPRPAPRPDKTAQKPKPATDPKEPPPAGPHAKPAASKPDPHAKPDVHAKPDAHAKPEEKKSAGHKDEKKSVDHEGKAKQASAAAHKPEPAKHH
ncbi:MAG: hypothetical protein R2762_19660 [Bryobacteraceae bacterium]